MKVFAKLWDKPHNLFLPLGVILGNVLEVEAFNDACSSLFELATKNHNCVKDLSTISYMSMPIENH